MVHGILNREDTSLVSMPLLSFLYALVLPVQEL